MSNSLKWNNLSDGNYVNLINTVYGTVVLNIFTDNNHNNKYDFFWSGNLAVKKYYANANVMSNYIYLKP